MKALIVDTYYPRFLYDFVQKSDISTRSYTEQRQLLLDACFGVSDFYSRHLQKLGIDAEDVIANCAPLQAQWARERGLFKSSLLMRLPKRWTRFGLVGKLLDKAQSLLPILAEQVRRSRPDVLYLQDLSLIPPTLLRSLKPHVGLVVGQTAAPLPPVEFLAPYDLILTSFPHYVPRLRALGIASEYFRLGFDAAVLDRVGAPPRQYACTFVGGISSLHTRGTAFLEHLARHSDIAFFGYGAATLPADSPIVKRHRGEVWALDMYRALAQSHITVNRHIDVAENNANNMRLYEATGMGAMLLTDAKANLGELFEVGKEVVAYRDAAEAVELIRYYTAHPEERDAIARAGQQRTLRSHGYEQRMVELRDILTRYLNPRAVA